MKDEIDIGVKIEQRLESYKSFFDHAWSMQMLDLVAGTKIEKVTLLFVVNMRAAANCHAFPWVMIHSISNFGRNFLESQLQSNFINALASEIPKRLDGKISRMRCREIRQIIQEMAQKVDIALEHHAKTDQTCSPESLWAGYLEEQNHEWVAAIWGSQRFVFTNLFFAFESFVKDVVGVAENNDDYEGFPFRTLVDDATKHFGNDTVNKCIGGDFVKVTKLVRNALAHNSGKESKKLREWIGHGIDVTDGIVQIQCPDNATLCRAIAKRSMYLVEAAIKLPQFKQSAA